MNRTNGRKKAQGSTHSLSARWASIHGAARRRADTSRTTLVLPVQCSRYWSVSSWGNPTFRVNIMQLRGS